MKKKIGITFSETGFENYLKWFEDSDVDVVVISSEDVKDFRLMEFDGFVLTGGVDTDPSLYGGPADYDNRPAVFNTARDLFESRVYTHARAQGIPLLGICRGMQLVNIVEGGGMVQDLGHEANRAHRKEDGVDKSHLVRMEEGSLMRELCEAVRGTTNSAHHQAVDAKALPSSLRITAWSEDGVPEALEHSNPSGKSFMLCVQWHPERTEDAALGVGVIARLVEASHYYVGALPGVIVALALVTITVRVALPLYQTLATLLLAYLLMFLPPSLLLHRLLLLPSLLLL
jgi:putative glutamine amidotransferase